MRIHKIMYIAPRYHTNQVPIVRGLIEKGIEVRFISQYAGAVEDYTNITPHVLGYSKLYLIPSQILAKLRGTDIKAQNDNRMKHGIPPFGQIKKQLQDFGPDVVILRERSMYTIAAYRVCRKKGIPCILYNQSPLYEDCVKNDLPHRIVRSLVPPVRITPVYGEARSDQVIEPGSKYVPFVMPLNFDPLERTWLKDNILHIFTVGKYEKRKNLLMIASVVSRINKMLTDTEKPDSGLGVAGVELTIAGECTSDAHKAYYKQVEEYIESNHLQKHIILKSNLDSALMAEEYKKADLFVIPSTAEPASISQLEAMSYGLPAICGDKNGTACHVEQGINGYRFTDKDEDSLYEQVKKFLEPNLCKKMGIESYRLVGEKYNIDAYLEGIGYQDDGE